MPSQYGFPGQRYSRRDRLNSKINPVAPIQPIPLVLRYQRRMEKCHREIHYQCLLRLEDELKEQRKSNMLLESEVRTFKSNDLQCKNIQEFIENSKLNVEYPHKTGERMLQCHREIQSKALVRLESTLKCQRKSNMKLEDLICTLQTRHSRCIAVKQVDKELALTMHQLEVAHMRLITVRDEICDAEAVHVLIDSSSEDDDFVHCESSGSGCNG
jgi:hypothetical protein